MTATVEDVTAPGTGLAGDLLLARLLPATKARPRPPQVRADVARFFRHPLPDEPWQELIDGLVHAGLLTARPLGLTAAGRARALDFLGVREVSARYNWRQIRTHFLLPKVLGYAPDGAAGRGRMRPEKLAAVLLKRRFDLPVGADPSLGDVLQALVCRELGFPGTASLAEVQRLVLARLVGAGTPLDATGLRKQLPRVLLGAKNGGVAGLRDVVLDGWADGPIPAPPPARLPEAAAEEAFAGGFDLPAFAATVKAAARDCPTGWFGDNKVFISHLWRRLRDEPGFPVKDLAAFKRRLTEANNARLLNLSQADLVEVMDPTDVRESETRYLNATFHFLLVEREKP